MSGASEDKLRFLDTSLSLLAKKLGGKLMKDGVIFLEAKDKNRFHTRKIIWCDGEVGKAIIIEPHYDKDGITDLWDLSNLAWLENGPPDRKPMWEKYLAKGVELEYILNNIHSLLTESETNLKLIRIDNLN